MLIKFQVFILSSIINLKEELKNRIMIKKIDKIILLVGLDGQR